MSSLATALVALNSTALTDYAVSEGAPISSTTVGGVNTTSVGSVLSGPSGTIIIVVALIAIALIFIWK